MLAKSEERITEWSVAGPSLKSGSGFPATVCDFASAGTVPLAHIAGAAKAQSVTVSKELNAYILLIKTSKITKT